MSGRTGGVGQLALEDVLRAREIVTVRCAFCRRFKRTGPALEMLKLQRAHAETHLGPIRKSGRKRSRNSIAWLEPAKAAEGRERGSFVAR